MFLSLFENIAFSNECLNCEKPFLFKIQNLYCRDCLSQIKKKKIVYCHSCGKKTSFCVNCLKEKIFDNIGIFSIYSGLLKEIILKYKFEGFKNLSKEIANVIREDFKLFTHNLNIDFFLPTPSSKSMEKKRGFNHLLEILVNIMDKEKISLSLIKIKDTPTQVSLSGKERASNLKDAFYLKNPWIFENKNILIFDDITTTGSTLKEIYYTVIKAKPKNIYAYVIAT